MSWAFEVTNQFGNTFLLTNQNESFSRASCYTFTDVTGCALTNHSRQALSQTNQNKPLSSDCHDFMIFKMIAHSLIPAISYILICFEDSWNYTNGHLSRMVTFLGGQSIHWLLFKPLYNGHLSTTATSLQWSLLWQTVHTLTLV